MNIVIYEDSFTHRNFLTKTIREYIQNSFDDIKLELCTDNQADIEKYIEKNQMFTLYLLDIVDKDDKTTGLELAELIKEKNSSDVIVFITQYIKTILYETKHKILALNIITKISKSIKSEIVDTIKFAYGKLPDKNCLIVNSGFGDIFKVAYDDIYMIESIKSSHKIRIYYKNNGEFEFKAVLKDIFESLDGRFKHCHRCCIINVDKVVKMQRNPRKIIFDNGLFCLYSINFKMEVSKHGNMECLYV